MVLDRATETFLRQFGESATITTSGGTEVTANVYLTNLETFEEGGGDSNTKGGYDTRANCSSISNNKWSKL